MYYDCQFIFGTLIFQNVSNSSNPRCDVKYRLCLEFNAANLSFPQGYSLYFIGASQSKNHLRRDSEETGISSGGVPTLAGAFEPSNRLAIQLLMAVLELGKDGLAFLKVPAMNK